MTGSVTAFLRCESGTTAIEYAVVAAGIAVAIIALVFDIGSSLNTRYQSVVDGLGDLAE